MPTCDGLKVEEIESFTAVNKRTVHIEITVRSEYLQWHVRMGYRCWVIAMNITMNTADATTS